MTSTFVASTMCARPLLLTQVLEPVNMLSDLFCREQEILRWPRKGGEGSHSCLLEKATAGPNVGKGRIARGTDGEEERGEVKVRWKMKLQSSVFRRRKKKGE